MNLPEQNSSSINTDKKFMALAITEAKRGLGRTSPNPCVGAVIVHDGHEISRGYHKKAGTPHAEINAISKAGDKAQGATMYVTLEPCNHTGRTPPCSHAVVKAGIKRVVVGMADPNPLVSGSGVDYLRDHGVEVLTSVLEEDCRKLNLPFLKHITTGIPYVILKAGMSLDGKLSYQKGVPGKMTGPASLKNFMS
jgi:diaminohydroxyphosphoribosylaminopyrimidine deaminase/5-amino-6-(5-phosphoribosylamino)uracil reductase